MLKEKPDKGEFATFNSSINLLHKFTLLLIGYFHLFKKKREREREIRRRLYKSIIKRLALSTKEYYEI